ncbi:MAG TPA: hypothetical protein PKD51_10080 [Saprospiraceae bacterium]|nr:hypothetical protein [Saprospiraceae bacterium]
MDSTNTEIENRLWHGSYQCEPRAMKDEQGREYFEFELSNELKDQHRTIFRMAGGKIDEFNNEPIVTYGHPSFDSTDPDDIIGTGPAFFQDGKLIGRYYPEDGEDNPKAKKVVAKLRAGLIKSASIVAEIVDHSRGAKDKGEDSNVVYFRDWNLLMWGIVMKGSNPKAKLRTQARALEFYNSATPTEPDTPDTPDTSQLEAVIILQEQRLRLMKLDISNSVAP